MILILSWHSTLECIQGQLLLRRLEGEKAVAESLPLVKSSLMSPLRLFKRWIASEHQHLGSLSPFIPISHLPAPKCYSARCLWNSGCRKICNVMTDFLSPEHSLTVAVEKRKKNKKSGVLRMPESSLCCDFQILGFWSLRNLPWQGLGCFWFSYDKFAIRYLHKDALTQKSVENHINGEVHERSQWVWDQNISWSKACW